MSASPEMTQALIEMLRLQLVTAGSLFTLTQRVQKTEELAKKMLASNPELLESFSESIKQDLEVSEKLEKEIRGQITAALEALEGVPRG